MKRTYARAGIPFVADFEDVCRVADVYVCDNSSTLFEFAATGRPVVVMNARQWSRKLSHGLRFWEASHVGINVDRSIDLIPAIHEAVADAPERQKDREDALQIVYGLRTNGAAAAATAILDWLAGQQSIAA
jgi:CDP-glycerol glycerophosphotransferase (TagB/SpsB family)